ncbi:MAG: hypothetical protein JRI68_01835 [Deltaproteobacteria bacterium]|nr:hypothetical protein [Deltaproteobacteria bacterium]
MPEFAELLPLSWGTAIALEMGTSVAAAVVFGRVGVRRYLAWTLAAVAPVVTWLAPATPAIGRFLLAMGGALTVAHLFDLMRDRRDLSIGQRVWFILTPFDTRAVRPVPRALRPRLLVATAAWAGLSASCYWLFVHYMPAAGLPRLLVRWSLGLVGFYTLVEAIGAAMVQGHLVAGMQTPTLHVTPALARTLQEFWSERWNLEVRRLLHRYAFMPLARRRRPLAGLMAAFVVSGVLHVGLMLPTRGWEMAGLWALFFLVQGVLILVERGLGVARWPRPAARIWTLTLLVLSSPLFIEPLLRIFPG